MQSASNISAFENKRVLIVGDIILDEFVYGTQERMSPEHREVPVLDVLERRQYLGGAANVALNIRQLKAIPYLAGTVGKDTAGDAVYRLLHQHDISNEYVHTNQRQATTHKTRFFRDGQPFCRIDEDGNIEEPELIAHFILKNVAAAILHHKPHVMILQDYNKGVLSASVIPPLLALARQHRMLVCVDPKFDNWELYQEADLFKPNKAEFDFITSAANKQPEDILKSAAELRQKIQYKNLLLTLGAEGNFIADEQQTSFIRQVTTVENPDVCGAGDTVIAVASLALACGFPLSDIAALANKAGAVVCQKKDIQPVQFNEL